MLVGMATVSESPLLPGEPCLPPARLPSQGEARHDNGEYDQDYKTVKIAPSIAKSFLRRR